MAERVLSERELNRALLARQLLLERGRGSIAKTLERMGGLQAQYAPSMYVGLWSRIEGFERDALTRALERRSVVQGTLLRSTIHLVSKGDYWSWAIAVREARRAGWASTPWRKEVSARQIATAARAIAREFGGREFEQSELNEFLGDRPPRVSVWRNGVMLWLDLVRVPPSGTWERRRADRYALASDWVGPEDVSEVEGIELLVRRYLAGFGPASEAQLANWAGLPRKVIAPPLARIGTRRFQAENGTDLFDLPRAPLPGPETPAPVRFLPAWDATLLAHARRTRILPEEYRTRVFSTKAPQSVSTFLVDGQVAGTWRFENGRIETRPFGRLDAATTRELAAERERLAELHA